MTAQIDNADRLILDLVQDNSRIGLDVLAEECSLSVPSVQRRLKRLRDTGVISKEIALVDPASLGYGMTFIVMVELERETLHQLDAFRKRAQSEPQVQQCYYVTGEADFTLICTARDMQDFEQLTHRLFFNDGNVRRFRTSVVMDRSKVGLNVPCEK
ncbi:Lrp/AsnC family transcriptional regulator [Roseibium sp. SCP14]|uniref:Lrp/AsnC family transcriptional regulator n=1 Tax=Roseibium sp. SCP14 TaxID=3141375 RepID=UPI00333DCFB5